MEVSDLDLCNHTDIALLIKIMKNASSQKLNFLSLQLSLKSMIKAKEINCIDKYLNFFMMLKGEVKDDSAVNWNLIFHKRIRQLQREVLAEVHHQTSLTKKSFKCWKSKFSIKQKETFIVTNQQEQDNKQVIQSVDPSIKMKAKVFHYWVMYTQHKTMKKQHKSNLNNQIQKIGLNYQKSVISFTLRIWRDRCKTKKYLTQIINDLSNNINTNRQTQFILKLKQNNERKEIVSALHMKITKSIIKLKQHSVFNKLRENYSLIKKVPNFKSYHVIIFLKYLIELSFNNSKPVSYQKFHTLLTFKSKIKRQMFDQQMKVFYQLLKIKSFNALKSRLQAKKKQINQIRNNLKKHWLTLWKHQNSTFRKIFKNKLLLKNVISKKSFLKLKQSIKNRKQMKNIQNQLFNSVRQKLSFIQKQKRFIEIKENLKVNEQYNVKIYKIRQYCRSQLVSFAVKQIQRNLHRKQIEHNIPFISATSLIKKYFVEWKKFYQQRDDNMTQIYKFQIQHSKKLKSAFIQGIKQRMNKKQEVQNSQNQIQKIIKRRILLKCIDFHNRTKQLKQNNQSANLRKRIQFQRFIKRINKVLFYEQRQIKKFQNTIHRQKISNIFQSLKQNIKQTQCKKQQLKDYLLSSSIKHLFIKLAQNQKQNKLSSLVLKYKHQKQVTSFLKSISISTKKHQYTFQKSKRLNQSLSKIRRSCFYKTIKIKTEEVQKMNILKNVFTIFKSNTIQVQKTESNLNICSNYFKQVLMQRKMKNINVKIKQFIESHNHNIEISQKMTSIINNMKLNSAKVLIDKLEIKKNTIQLQQRIFEIKQQKWRVKLSKINDSKIATFKLDRQIKIQRKTLTTLLFELQKRQKAIQIMSSIFKSKCLSILKFSMNSIFQQYRISFKLSACQRIRKRFCLQKLIFNHMQKQNTKLQQYKSVKHYAENLIMKSFKGLVLAVYSEDNNKQNIILKTQPKITGYIR